MLVLIKSNTIEYIEVTITGIEQRVCKKTKQKTSTGPPLYQGFFFFLTIPSDA